MTTAQTQCINPATGEIIGNFPIQSPGDLKDIIDKARKVQKEWESIPLKQRIKHIKKLGYYIFNHADRISKVISENNGKTINEAFASEVFPSIMAVSYDCKMVKE